MKNIVTVIQARLGSSRLPNKVMMDILGQPLLLRMIARVQKSQLKGTVVVATTVEGEDDMIETLCSENDIHCYRGSKVDLLDRHYQAAKLFQADAVVKIPSDCPLIHSSVIDKVLGYFLKHDFDYVSNLHPATYPDGNDVEIMTFTSLEKAWKEADKNFEREHTTPYFWENPGIFHIGNVAWETGLDYSMSHRWTIDYPEDYQFIKAVYENLYPLNPNFTLQEIIDLTREREDIFSINHKYAGVNWYRNHLDELKTVKPEQTKQAS